MSVNKTILLGILGGDPDIRVLDNGKKVANFSLATNESYKNKQGEKVTDTEWHRIVAFSPLADIIEKWVKKGSKIYVEGKNKTRSWDKDGVKIYTTEVHIREITMLGGDNQNKPQDQQPATQTNVIDQMTQVDSDDLPF